MGQQSFDLLRLELRPKLCRAHRLHREGPARWRGDSSLRRSRPRRRPCGCYRLGLLRLLVRFTYALSSFIHTWSGCRIFPSLTTPCYLLLLWGSTRATWQFSWGRGRKVMHLPCKRAQAGALPAVLHHPSLAPRATRGVQANLEISGQSQNTQFALRETRPKHREKPHKLLQVGATPTPATN